MNAGRGARGHAGWWAFVAHRVSGVALAAFLPMHFIALGLALDSADRFARFIDVAQSGIVKFAEWGLVMALTVHLSLGVRLLIVELGPWRGLRNAWIGWGAGAAVAAGLVFAVFAV